MAKFESFVVSEKIFEITRQFFKAVNFSAKLARILSEGLPKVKVSIKLRIRIYTNCLLFVDENIVKILWDKMLLTFV